MIPAFIERFQLCKDNLAAAFAEEHPQTYKKILKQTLALMFECDEYDQPDPGRITCIDDGDYQGTLVFVVASTGYQPSTYWATNVSYGSCSGCDTLQAIQNYTNEPPTAEQVKDYVTLALHMVEKMRLITSES